jgi:2-deoxy-D-gluconate 3-dehydrogenase
MSEMSTLFDLSGKKAIVTGGARGLGQAMAVGLAEAGADVLIVTNASKADETVSQITALGRKAYVVPAAEHSAEDWHAVIQLNLNAAFFITQAVGKQMLKQKSGKIINIASMLSYQGGITVPGYTASKHGIAGLTKAFANEWAVSGIQVNAIAPGYMSTDNTAALRANETRNRQILERIPAQRWGSPEDLKGAAVFLASKGSDYVTGHTLCVDGGWMVR